MPTHPPVVEPPKPAEPASQPAPEWPYPPFEGPFSDKPTWECPGGTCECHPVPEDEPIDEHVIVFYDSHGVRMAGARCRVYEQGRLLTPEPCTADGAGELRVELRAATSTLRVEWAPPHLPAHQFLPYRKIYNVKMSDDADIGLDRRLANLGFSQGKRRRDNVADYQRAYSRDPNGNPDEIRLEVLDRHDNGTVTPFHPQAPAGPTESPPPQTRSLFASPPAHSGSSVRTLAPDEQQEGGGSSGAGQGATTKSGQNVQGAAVPNAADFMLVVMVSPDFAALDPKHTKVQMRPRVVPGMAPEQLGQNIEPTVKPTTASSVAVYEFKDLPMGTYDALVYVDKISRGAGKGETFALGHKEFTIRKALVNQGWVIAEVGRPILTVSDPLLELDIERMQRRRKVLATIYQTFPQSARGREVTAQMGIKPPYEQGPYETMTADDSKNTCSAINTMTNNFASAKNTHIDPKWPKAGPVPDGNGYSFGYNSVNHPAYVHYADGLLPSVGDTACYRGSDGQVHHCGFIVGIVDLLVPTDPAAARAPAATELGWISADGGQPDTTSEFKDGAKGWRRYYTPPPSREAAFLLPRLLTITSSPATAYIQNLFIFPLAKGGGYSVDGWLDVSDPRVRFDKPDYGKPYDTVTYGTKEDYEAMKKFLLAFPGKVDNARQADFDVKKEAGG